MIASGLRTIEAFGKDDAGKCVGSLLLYGDHQQLQWIMKKRKERWRCSGEKKPIVSNNVVEIDPLLSMWNSLKMLEPLHHRLYVGGTQLWPGHLCCLYFPLHAIYQSPMKTASFAEELENFLLPDDPSCVFCLIGSHWKKAA